MLKKQIKYTDYNGVERTENFYFNFSKAEIFVMENSINGGLSALIEEITNTMNQVRLIELFEKLILDAVGIKSLDGKTFKKSPEIRDDFKQSEAYSVLLMEFVQSENPAEAVAAFINAIIPQGVELSKKE